jgi:hypothetical protein
LIFDAELLELCSHNLKSALEDADDLVSNLGRREGGSVYESTPTIDLILGADDHLIGIVIHGDEALRLLDLSHQIIGGHGLVSVGGLSKLTVIGWVNRSSVSSESHATNRPPTPLNHLYSGVAVIWCL